MSATPRWLIIIPTRNRSELAMAAASSVIDEPPIPGLQVLISDNSTEAAEVERLQSFATSNAARGVSYMRPPSPLPMAAHWEWALGEALARFTPTHVTVLTDRMLFRSGALEHVYRSFQQNPQHVLCYNHDQIDDFSRPVVLKREPWTNLLLRVSSRQLLDLSSELRFRSSLPRLLNCVVPARVFADIKQAFGDICLSIAPDFCFCYRLLSLSEELFYLDRPALIHYAISRSNGHSTIRGVLSKDSADFQAALQAEKPLPCAPWPEFMTVSNTIIHEYCRTRQQAPARSLRDVKRSKYVKSLYNEINNFMDPGARQTTLAHFMDRIGWHEYVGFILPLQIKRTLKARKPAAARPSGGDLAFDDVAAALAFDRANPAAPSSSKDHLQKRGIIDRL